MSFHVYIIKSRSSLRYYCGQTAHLSRTLEQHNDPDYHGTKTTIRFAGLIQNSEVSDYADLARLGYVTRARITQIMSLLNLAPDIQEEILFLPRTTTGRDRIKERDVRRIAAVPHWHRQRRMWEKLVKDRSQAEQ